LKWVWIKKKIGLSLKKEIRKIFLWLEMSLHKEKQREENLTLMYEATHRESFSLVEDLEKMIQLEWFGTPTNTSLSLLLELGIEQIVVQDGSWIKMISKSDWVLRMVLTTELFFQTFCEKIFKFLIIMLSYHSQLNESALTKFLILFEIPFFVETMSPEWA